jgi:hypothetical protein
VLKVQLVVKQYYISGILGINTGSAFAFSVKYWLLLSFLNVEPEDFSCCVIFWGH